MTKIIIVSLLVVIILEILLFKLVNFLRNYFNNSQNWIKNRFVTNIITENKDYFPKIEREELNRFKIYMEDKDLGTTYKKNTSVVEKYYKNKIIKTRYTIDKKGSRLNKLYKNKNLISCYGDSLSFCRYTNDNQTWEYYLSKLTKSNVKNYGVGNYGLDQSYLKFLNNTYENSKTIIFAVGPETIRRDLSLWKHYYEFGNIFYFKPAFLLNKKKQLVKHPLKVKNISLKTNFFKIHKKIKNYDFFYKEKFLKYLWSRPYLFSTIINFPRKFMIILFFSLKYIELEKKNKLTKIINEKIFSEMNLLGGLRYDFLDRLNYFKDNKYYNNSIYLLKKIKNEIKKRNKKILLVIIPAHYDYVYLKKTKKNYYKNFISECEKYVDCLDLGQYLNYDEKKIFSDKGFGGHYNAYGNKIISKIIYNHLKKNKYI